jgi:hypothetical protein
MIMMMKKNLYAVALIMVHTTSLIHGFGVSSPISRIESFPSPIVTTPKISTALEAEREGSRRRFFASVRRLFLGAGAVSSVVGGRLVPVFAESTDGSSTSIGNIVEIQVSNLDGNPDSTGTIKIQLKPEWVSSTVVYL